MSLMKGPMSIDLGLPTMPPPTLAPRRKTRQIKVGKVLVGGDAPISVQSMTTTLDRRHQRHPAADRRAHRDRLRHRTGRRAQPGRCGRTAGHRAQVADPGHRRHPLPAEVRLRRHRRRLCRGPGQSGQHQGLRRQGRRDRQGRDRRRLLDPDRRQCRLAGQAAARQIRQGDPGGTGRVGALGGEPVRGAWLHRLQDLGQAPRPGDHGPGVRAAVAKPATIRCT